MKTQYGDLVSGDLKDNTMTFEIEGDMVIKAGRYAIVPVEENEIMLSCGTCKHGDGWKCHHQQGCEGEYELWEKL